MIRARTILSAVTVSAVALLVAGCGPTDYRGFDSDIDGALWRQIAAFEDPCHSSSSNRLSTSPSPT